MDYDEYLKMKKVSDKDAHVCKPVSGRFEIIDDEDLKVAKDAIERYEEENFSLTYEDCQKMDECFDDAVEQIKYMGDDEVGYEESELSRIVRVMNFLDWTYGFSDRKMTEDECLECLDSLYRDAMRGLTNHKTRHITMATGGWYVELNVEHHSVRVHFCLFDYYEYHDELMELKQIEKNS